MTEYNLRTPLTEKTVRKLKAEDVIYLSGTVVTARDQAHQRALELHRQGKPLPVKLEGLAVFHCGPIMTRHDDKWMAVAAGPTTSIRMETYEAEFIKNFKPRIVIGKGGMGEKTADAMAEFGAVYCAFTGGAAVLAAEKVKQVRGVEWLDLGMPEAMWILEVKAFGPLVVAIDSHGRNLYAEVIEAATKSIR